MHLLFYLFIYFLFLFFFWGGGGGGGGWGADALQLWTLIGLVAASVIIVSQGKTLKFRQRIVHKMNKGQYVRYIVSKS